jgi:glutamate racemase
VLGPLREMLRGEDVVYVADQAWVPYGPRPAEVIRERAFVVTEALLERGAKVIVVACNSASTAALGALRERLPEVPFVGMEPAVKPAAERTRSGNVGVLATAATAQGERLANLIDRFGRGVTVHVEVPEGLVELVEAGLGESDQSAALLAPILARWHSAGVDSIVLGCTHYPFAVRTIERLVGDDVAVINPAPAVARQAVRVLTDRGLLRAEEAGRDGRVTFLTTGEPGELRTAVRRLAGDELAGTASFGLLASALPV